jgi:hypothetical protein
MPPAQRVAEIACGGELIIDLDSLSLPHVTAHGDANYDLVYYESPGCSGICLDWVIVDVCDTLPCPTWLTVFNWGDDIPDNNTNVAAYSAGGELDNKDIPPSALLNSIGITIDVDAFGPSPIGGYRYVRVRSPVNWPDNDGSQIDSIEIVP